ncbi:MAG: undecaprenyl-phosphate glucose phosphotransferase [Hyphomicrobium sp.]|jgi:Undecaprenyl-phosphate glucose phosphotransferase
MSTTTPDYKDHRLGNPILHRIAGSPAAALHAIDAWYSDKRRNISRPKLLFTVCLLDVLVVVVCGLGANYWLAGTNSIAATGLVQVLAVAFATTALMHSYWSYSVHALRNAATQVGKIVKAALVVFCCASGAAYIAQSTFFAPTAVLVWLLAASLLMIGQRFAVARMLHVLTLQDRLVRRTVIVGGGAGADQLIDVLARDDLKEMQILGVFDDRLDERSSESVSGYPKLGRFDELANFCRENSVDLLIVTVPQAAEKRLLDIMHQLLALPVDIRISALGSKLRLSSGAYTYLGRVPMLAVMDKPLTDWDRVLKNIEDRILALLLLILAAPVMAAVAVAIRYESKGPIIFRQRRYGFNNELVEVWKFRSLYADRQDLTASKLVTKDDPRVTRVGRFIRRTSLDELPQLINVLRGDMSLVGPRPHATEAKADDDLYQTVVDGYFSRHRVKPGVTGWAQINGWRGETDTHDKIQRRVEADVYYIDNWSVLFDLYIIAMTPIVLISGKNAH